MLTLLSALALTAAEPRIDYFVPVQANSRYEKTENWKLREFGRIRAHNGPYTQALARYYGSFSDYLGAAEGWRGKSFSDYFARKALEAAGGNPVGPETFQRWTITDRMAFPLAESRKRLVTAAERGARQAAPDAMARAQTRFDCWVVHAHTFGDEAINSPCRHEFGQALALAENQARQSLKPPAIPKGRTAALTGHEQEALRIRDAQYIIFFDFDSAQLDREANEVIDSAAEILKTADRLHREGAMGQQVDLVLVTGHADRAGPSDYNEELGLRRARNVREALVQRGVSEGMIRIESRGEREAVVQTPDNVREQANRRVTITFE